MQWWEKLHGWKKPSIQLLAAAHVHVNGNGLRTGLIEHRVAFGEGPYAISTHHMF